ncbi:Haloacid_dehalogenase-like hydrolase family protein [Hexamita inflata]|uniref:Haloacid dehalogenase-like hydrolase family protein n=1 Tax=Hexamita inflata TaxID=28002 RepID=A0AA86PKQ4_9EUKA|nr:Haloacid dehalogenase-like hydrolase family protein [Hexamita inflata]
MNVIFFDIDGVIVKECGVAEFGYGFLIQLLSEPDFDLTARLEDLCVKPQYLKIAHETRNLVKGKHPVDKIKIFKQYLESSVKSDDAWCVTQWYNAQRRYIQKNYPIEQYIMPGIMSVFSSIQQLRSKHQIKVVAATANEQWQATWLLQYAGVYSFFDDVLGYQLESLTDQPRSKVEMLANYLQPIKNIKSKIMIGDGIPDMKAGRMNDCVCLGIGAEELKTAGADEVFREEDYEKLAISIQKVVEGK